MPNRNPNPEPADYGDPFELTIRSEAIREANDCRANSPAAITARIADIDAELDATAAELNGDPAATAEGQATAAKIVLLDARRRGAVEALEEAQASPAAGPVHWSPLHDGESAEQRALNRRASLSNYISASIADRAPKGAEAELSASYQLPETHTPWSALAPRSEPLAADAPTTLPGTGTETREDPYVSRVFAGSVVELLGIDRRMIPFGELSVPVVSSGVNPAILAKGGDKDAEALTVTFAKLEPHRLGANFLWRIEDAMRSPNLEDALRVDLSQAIAEATSARVLNGDGTAPDISGLFHLLADPGTAAANVLDFPLTVALASGAVDGKHAQNIAQVAVLVGTKTYEKAASVFQANGTASGADYLAEMSMGIRASSLITAPASNVQQGIAYRAGVMGGNAVLGVWEGLQFIRDPYSKASSGELRLTANFLFDFALTRADAYKQIDAKLA